MTPTSVKIIAGALDELPDGRIILRGVLCTSALATLLSDDYQREAQPMSAQASILAAYDKGQPVPDIELGMRGQNFMSGKDDTFYLKDPVYIIDGLQRVTAARIFLNTNKTDTVRIGATIHFNTTKEWERERFQILNTQGLKVSPNVILRNMRDRSPVVLTLYGLTHNDQNFPLYRKVSWQQRMVRGELTSAMTLAKVTGYLHSHLAPGRYTTVSDLVPALDRGSTAVGIANFRANLHTFFGLLDDCWGVSSIQYSQGAVYLRLNFLTTLAMVLSDHEDFWTNDDKKLFVNMDLKRKIGAFPLNDPEITRVATAGGMARRILYNLLVQHINSGKRTKRLTERQNAQSGIEADDDEAAA